MGEKFLLLLIAIVSSALALFGALAWLFDWGPGGEPLSAPLRDIARNTAALAVSVIVLIVYLWGKERK